MSADPRVLQWGFAMQSASICCKRNHIQRRDGDVFRHRKSIEHNQPVHWVTNALRGMFSLNQTTFNQKTEGDLCLMCSQVILEEKRGPKLPSALRHKYWSGPYEATEEKLLSRLFKESQLQEISREEVSKLNPFLVALIAIGQGQIRQWRPGDGLESSRNQTKRRLSFHFKSHIS